MSALNGLHVDAVGVKRWFRNNELHREDGAAIEYPNGDKMWLLNGLFISYDPNFTVSKLRAYLLLG